MTASRSRLLWLCRRGSRELDLLLQAYLEERYDEAPPREQEAFAALLEQGDDDLRGLLMGPQEYRDPTLTALVTRIRAAAAHHAQAVTAI